MEKIAVIILDAMDPEFLRAIESTKIVEHYNQKGDILTVSDYPHTQSSAILMYSGVKYPTPFWLKPRTAQGNQFARIMQARQGALDPAAIFDRDKGDVIDDKFTLYKRSDFGKFIWDYLQDRAEAVQIPIVLPPYDFNAHATTEYWFPDSRERQYYCNRDLTAISLEGVERLGNDEIDFFTCWLPSYDKLLHGVGEGHFGEDFVKQETKLLDDFVDNFITNCEDYGVHYIIMGDHGSPSPGVVHTGTNFNLPMHRKHSCIISDFSNQPKYTDELFDFMCDMMEVKKKIEGNSKINERYDKSGTEIDEVFTPEEERKVRERLEALGYL